MATETYYHWHQGGGFIIKCCPKTFLYELWDVPLYGGEEDYISTFSTIGDAKKHADKLIQ